jgi:transcriptional regulator with PAS, ATPase and Fis domain
MVTDGVHRLTGTSPAVRVLEQEIEWAGRCDSKVFITGESGVGKEVVAQLIHGRSLRRRAPMFAVNCAGFPDSLLESELFGHERGSFTGAFRDKPGLFEAAHQGTLFLDEVCEMSQRMQALLLRFLETGETQRVGADKPHGRLDVRVIAATNKDVAQCIAAGEFRQDLYFRLNVLRVAVPPLRERPEDIPPLMDHFLKVYSAQRGIAVPAVESTVRQRLMSHLWPGNIRELRNVIEYAVLRVDRDVIGLDDLPPQFRQQMPPRAAPHQPIAHASVAQTLYDRMAAGGESFWSIVHEPFMARDITRQDVRDTVRLGLEHTSGDYRAVAELFHVPPDSYKRFLNFLRTYGCHLAVHDFRASPTVVSVGSRESPREE